MKKSIFWRVVLLILAMPAILTAQWSHDPMENTMVRDTTGLLAVAHVTPSQNGNTYVSWYSATEGLRFDLAMQYFDINGNKLWGENGLMISTHPTNTWVTDYCLAVDQQGNAIITSQDYRDGYSNVYAWRISPQGAHLWDPEGLKLTNTTDFNPAPQVLVTDDNSFIFTYDIEPEDTTQATRIGIQGRDDQGNWIWEETIAESDISYLLPQSLLLDDGSLIVAWAGCYSGEDTILGQENFIHYYMQRFSQLTGQPLWSLPLQLDTGDVVIWGAVFAKVSLASDGDGSVYVSYPYFIDQEPMVMVNHVNSDGDKLFGENGQPVAVNPGHEYMEGYLCYNASYGFPYIFFREVQYDPVNLTYCYAISGQKFSPTGERLWNDTAKRIIPFICDNDTSIYGGLVSPAGDQGNGLLYFREFLEIIGKDTLINTEIYAALLDEEGEFLWPDEQLPVSLFPSYKLQADLGDFSQGQWVTAWGDNRQDVNQEEYTGIYAQNITIDGNLGPLALPEALVSSHSNLRCYPSPFNELLTVSYDLVSTQEVIIQLIDIQGRIIKEYDAGRQVAGSHVYEVALPGLDPGIYVIQVLSNQGRQRSKIMKSWPGH